jgi:hypothetical protein
MKRREFIEYGMLGSAAFLSDLVLLNLKPSRASLSADMNNKQRYDWIFLYWMPYDNDLSDFGAPIMNMIASGVRSENILVVVESDFWDAKQLSRSVISKGKINTQKLDTANSASEEVFADYLNWAQSRFETDRWVIVFLGHGGQLDEISPDEHPGSSLVGTQWMNIKKLSDAIANFNQQINNRVELFFFQNCNKGTLEAHYTFRDTAKYTLSSQKLLGAPNYYYESLFQFIGNHPELNGEQLAQKIRQFEGGDMYHSYTVTNNRSFSEISETFNSFIDSILSANFKLIDTKELHKYCYFAEQHVDLVEFCKTITQQSGADPKKCNDVIECFNNSLIHMVNPLERQENLSGLGLFLPLKRKQLDKYRYLPIYSDLKLIELFDAILLD